MQSHDGDPCTQPIASRIGPAQEVAAAFKPGMRVAITTHVNADGDGTGSEAALWHLLTARGIRAAITNPTPFPDRFKFLIEGADHANKTDSAVRHLRGADLIVVMDISDVGRLGHLATLVGECGVPVVCIDHHLSDGSLPDGPRLIDSNACATGELVYDLCRACDWPITPEVAQGLYVAVMTDTGGFRFSNTTPRTLRIASDLLACGLSPEDMYRRVYASSSEGRIRLMSEVTDTLVVDDQRGLAWVTVPVGALERHGVDADELDGLVEFPRSISGTQIALLFRTLANNRVKVSFRSVGDVNVAALAEQFGGGGHRRAAGASLEGQLGAVQEIVLNAARALLDNGSHS